MKRLWDRLSFKMGKMGKTVLTLKRDPFHFWPLSSLPIPSACVTWHDFNIIRPTITFSHNLEEFWKLRANIPLSIPPQISWIKSMRYEQSLAFDLNLKSNPRGSIVIPRPVCILRLLYCDDVMAWKQFPRYCPCVRGIHPWLVDSPHKGPVSRASMFSVDVPHKGLMVLKELDDRFSIYWWIASSPG